MPRTACWSQYSTFSHLVSAMTPAYVTSPNLSQAAEAAKSLAEGHPSCARVLWLSFPVGFQ